jgi:hypothetical protein
MMKAESPKKILLWPNNAMRSSPSFPCRNQHRFQNNKNKKVKNMSTPIIDRDLTKQAPHSPRERIGGFAIAGRTIDKCRASITGKLGEYHYDCPLDNMLFSFKGINGGQFKTAVQAAKNYEEVGVWLQTNGTAKTPAEIKAWSDKVEAGSMMKDPEKRAFFIEECKKLGLDPEKSTTFDWLEADDRASFKSNPAT